MEQKQHDLGSTKLRRDRQNESQAEKGQSILWLRWLIAAVFFILVALLLMYAQRRMEMTPTRETWIRRGIFAAIALALVLFAYAVYLQYLI